MTSSQPSRGKKFTFKMADQAAVSCRPIRSSRRGVINYRSIDKVQSVILKDFEKGGNKEKPGQFYKCKVVSKPRNMDGQLKVKVRYVGWGRRYDEWRPLSELTGSADEPELDEEEQDEVVKLELGRIRVKIQESLTGLRRCDTLIKISEPVSEKTWRRISGACRVKKTFKKKSTLHCPRKSRFDKLFGAGWSRRYFNNKGDYSEVLMRTMQLHLMKKKALQCYEKKSNGSFVPKPLDRGLYVVIRFVRKDGNSL